MACLLPGAKCGSGLLECGKVCRVGLVACDGVIIQAVKSRNFGELNERRHTAKQLLHLVFGGELTSLKGHEFRNLDELDIVGIFPDYASAALAWKAKAQQTVDNAHMRYFIVHLHRLLNPAGQGG